MLFGSISFSTVLPAVLSVVEWLQSFRRLNAAFAKGWRPPALSTRGYGLLLLLASGSLLAIGVWPNYLFPLLCMAPLLVVVGAQGMAGEERVLDTLARAGYPLPPREHRFG